MTEQIKRSEAPVALTWDLTALFADEAAFTAAVTEAQAKTKALAKQEQTFTADAQQFAKTLASYYEANEALDRIGMYSMLAVAQDTTDPQAQQLAATAEQATTAFAQAVAWLEPAIVALPESRLAAFEAAEPTLKQYRHALAAIRTQVGHVLAPGEERVLAALGTTIDAPESIQSTLDDADLSFGTIEYDGQTQPMTKGLRRVIGENGPRPVRKQAAKQFDTAYYDHRFTFAQSLQAHVHAQNTLAQIRHYSSARAMDLSQNQISEAVYDTLLAETHAHLDLAHRYYALRKQTLGLDVMHPYDLSLPLTGGKTPFAPTYDEATATTLAALAPLGSDYQAHLEDEFAHRWVDVLETKGKTSGGFEDAAYGVHPYILLNWADNYDAMSTLAHESGHAMQSVYANANQPYWDSQYPIFTAEVASTTNESLLNAYLLNTTKDDRAKQIYLLSDEVENFLGTFYTQARFAEFELFMYQTEASGQPLTAEALTAKWDELEAAYYGPSVTPTPWPKAQWARIPHFFYNYYMYQYATSKAIATTFAKRILTEGEPAVAAYKAFLKAGNSDTPVNLLKRAGIDVTKPDYLDAAFAHVNGRLDQLAKLLNA
ncbi:oligoendopeptidase F [Lacticaseibacillus suibinensis]|uniref:oligoendopeptidase F n=1 Tax=Lacticaseibacillus suibinensis TaxID=2486011 RepID=UPI0013DE13F9|nr:oligoendopeptidase F [Lacticaseibacillus suibinensis]